MTALALHEPASRTEDPERGGGRAERLAVKAVTVTVDLIAIVSAMVVAFFLRHDLPGNDPIGAGPQHLLIGTISLPGWMLIFRHYRLYRARHIASRIEELRRVINAVVMSVLATAVASFMLHTDVARGWLLLTAVFAVIFVTMERTAIRAMFVALRRRGRMLRPVVIVGGNDEALALCSMLATDASLGYRVVGLVDDSAEVGSYLFDHRPVLGSVQQTLEAVLRIGATGVVVATTALDLPASNRLARELTEAGIHVEMSSSLRDIAAERLSLHPLGRFPMVYVEPVARQGWRPRAKRVLDVSVSVAMLVVTAPLLVGVGVLIKCTSTGPVLFRQERIGKNGRVFNLFKFRTMVVGAEEWVLDLRDQNEADGPLFKIRDDPRVTRFGHFLRTTSIDELPQLWNVLRGEMSLVGPRPALPREMAAWTPELHGRLRVKPGVTGAWQVAGRSECSFEDYTRLDLYYVDNWSLLTDLAIVARTVPSVLLRRGAY